MASLRVGLTVRYAVVMSLTIAALGVAVLLEHRAAQYHEAEDRARTRGDVAVGILSRAIPAVTVTPEQEYSSGFQRNTTDLLKVIPGFVLVLNRDQYHLYESPEVGDTSQLAQDDLAAASAALERGARAAEARVGGVQYLLVQTRHANVFYGPLRVITGVEEPSVVASFFEVLGATLIALPLILALSIGGAYMITGRALQPLESITSEVTAITDGRSLHRRLPLVARDDELTRLTLQLNSMIGRLEQSFSGLRRFTADASHELKTPLTVLRADVEHAMHAPPGSEEQLQALEEALQETTRMGDLVESLLTLARADEGRFDLHRERFTLEPLMRDVYETAVMLGEDAGLHVSMPVVEDAEILGDRSRLRQLFLNLVTNALKYTPRGGQVTLSLVRSDDTVAFSVRDTGIGISAADLPHVFERFWRADRARSRGSERAGVGLGLAIGQWIAQAHGGTLSVESRLHRGSTFTVTLPVAGHSPVPADLEPARG